MSKKNGPEPFYRPKRKRWYVEVDGRHVNLGPDEAQARIRWHQIMAGAAPDLPNAQPSHRVGELVCRVIDLFVGWSLIHRSGRTAEWYQDHLQSFLDSLPNAAALTVDELKRLHVTNWIDSHPNWGPNHRRGAITAVQRAFRWAEKEGYILKSPVRGIEKPPAKRREQVLSPQEFQALLERVKGAEFRDLLDFCWETGCRPEEVRLVDAAHVRFDRGRVELSPEVAKGKKRWRLIYLTPRAEDILRKLLKRHPKGLLFRNADGNAWDAQNINNRFCRLQHLLGRLELKRQGITLDDCHVRKFAATLKPTKVVKDRLIQKSQAELLCEARKKLTNKQAAKPGTKYALTALRHSFATRLLSGDCDELLTMRIIGLRLSTRRAGAGSPVRTSEGHWIPAEADSLGPSRPNQRACGTSGKADSYGAWTLQKTEDG